MSGNEPTIEITCPDCGSGFVTESWKEQRFQYGSGEKAVALTARVPVITCSDCGLQYSDDRGEIIRHEAICRHLGVLSPREIIALRTEIGLSRADFSTLIGCGIASLQRWESGSLIQNVSIDRLLRLMKFAHNTQFLKELTGQPVADPYQPSKNSNVVEMTSGSRGCRHLSRVSNPRYIEAAKLWRLRG